MGERDSGFTLIELLVVILIVAILAAVAIPVFLRQREKGYEAQVRSALKNAATAVESYGTENDGYGPLNSPNNLPALLAAQGFQIPEWSRPPREAFDIKSNATTYCIQARHRRLPSSHPWHMAVYRSADGRPSPDPDTC